MKKKKESQISANYLENIPVRNEKLKWTTDDDGIVTLHVHNTGFFNRACQKLFKKPEYTHVHLDQNGSFIWPLIDGEKQIMDYGEPVKERFGESAEPLYPRLAKFFQILQSYGFISYKEN
ncbi:MAG: PqqD family protein [Lachnospiraceae bacterium]